MSVSDCHVTDLDLLRRLDDELPESRRAVIDRHLQECETCRRRRAAIGETSTALIVACRTANDSGPSTEASRARLERGMVRMARERAVWNVGIAGAATPRRALAWSSAMAAAAMVSWLSVSIVPGAPYLRAFDSASPLPVASMTPGATWDVSAADLCAGTRHTRTITAAMRAQVVSAYGMEHVPSEQYELDYLITPELGGATDARNLWPQAYASPVWNARVKDELESLLPRLVCAGALDLATAQRDMAVDWIAAYKKYFNTNQPLRAHREPLLDDDDEAFILADARPAPVVRVVSMAVRR